MSNKNHSGRFRHIHPYSDIFRHTQTYAVITGIFRHTQKFFQPYSEHCVTLSYSELWYLQNSSIFKTRSIFKTLIYPKH